MATHSAVLRSDADVAQLWPLIAIGLVVFAAGCGWAIAFGEIGAFSVALACVAAIAVMFDYRIGAVLLILLIGVSATGIMPRAVLGVPALNPINILIVSTFFAYLVRHGVAHLAPQPLIWCVVIPMLAAGAMGIPHFEDMHPRFFEEETPIFTTAFGYFREYAVRPLLIPMMAVLIGAAVARSQKPERFLYVLIPSTLLIALIVFAYIIASGIDHLSVLATASARNFYNTLGVHANSLGRIFAMAYALLLFVWWEAKDPRFKVASFLALVVTALALALTFSRAAYLAAFIVSGLFVLWKFNARTVGLALLAGALAMLVAPFYVWRRLQYGFDSDMNTVSANRIELIWGPLFPELTNSPIWGNGIAATMWAEPMLTGEMMVVGHPHNAYLETFYDMGIIGLVLFLYYYWTVWRGFRALGSNAYLSPELRGFFQGATAALISFFVLGMAGNSLRPDPEFGYLWLAIGMMYGMLARKTAS